MELQTITLLFQEKKQNVASLELKEGCFGGVLSCNSPTCWFTTINSTINLSCADHQLVGCATLTWEILNSEMRTWTSRKCMFYSESGNLCCDVVSQLTCKFVLGGLIRRLNHEDPWRFRSIERVSIWTPEGSVEWTSPEKVQSTHWFLICL